MKKIIAIVIMVASTTILFSGCSYREFEDSLRDKEKVEGDDNYENNVTIPKEENKDETKEETKEETKGEANGQKQGEKHVFLYTDASGQQIQYLIKDSKLIHNINESGLNIKYFNDDNLIQPDGTLSSKVNDNNVMVIMDMKIKNISYVEEENGEPLVYIEPCIGYSSDITDPDGPWLIYACYYDGMLDSGQDFYKTRLEVGEEKEVKIGWIIDASRLEDEELFYVIGSGGYPEDYQFYTIK